jgi:hypothetical protein
MAEHGLSLTTDIKVELPRQDDCYLLPALQAHISDLNHLGIVNRCRLFLKALFLSDIVDGTGYEILQAAWNGDRVLGQHRLPSWPNQARPPPSDWEIWKLYLKRAFLGRGLRLRIPLGPWIIWDAS